MSVSESSHIDVVLEHVWFPISRWRAAGLPQDKIQPLQACDTELLDLRTQVFMSRRSLIDARAMVAHCDEQATDLVYLLGDALRSADRIAPDVKAMKTVFGDQTPSIVARPEGAGLGAQIETIDLLIARGGNLPATDAFESTRLLLSRLAESQIAARESLAQFQQVELQNQTLSSRVRTAKRSALAALNALRGELMVLYPRNRAKVRSFFLPTRRGSESQKTDDSQGADTPK